MGSSRNAPSNPIFLTRFRSQVSKGTYGSGQSFNALIPFEPDLHYPGLDSFNGHVIEKGKMAMKFKKIAVSNSDWQYRCWPDLASPGSRILLNLSEKSTWR